MLIPRHNHDVLLSQQKRVVLKYKNSHARYHLYLQQRMHKVNRVLIGYFGYSNFYIFIGLLTYNYRVEHTVD